MISAHTIPSGPVRFRYHSSDIAVKFGLLKKACDKYLIDELWDATEGVLPDDPAYDP